MSELELREITVLAGGRELLKRISLTVEVGQLIALVGPNGAGKTTLLKTALGLLRPSQGQVLIGGRELREFSPRQRAEHLSWLPQHVAVSEPLSAREVVVAARFRFHESRSASERAATEALERVGISQEASSPITQLSGGERQRVAMAALLAQDARIALLDEPANHLDPAQQLATYALLGKLWRLGLGMVVVTHDVNLLAELGSPADVRLVGLDRGQLAFDTSYGDSSLPRLLSALFEVDFSALELGGRRVLVAHGGASA